MEEGMKGVRDLVDVWMDGQIYEKLRYLERHWGREERRTSQCLLWARENKRFHLESWRAKDPHMETVPSYFGVILVIHDSKQFVPREEANISTMVWLPPKVTLNLAYCCVFYFLFRLTTPRPVGITSPSQSGRKNFCPNICVKWINILSPYGRWFPLKDYSVIFLILCAIWKAHITETHLWQIS